MLHPTVLFIEDELNLLNSLSYILEKEGMNVLKAASAEDGLEIIKKTLPDLILLDLSLPGMDGFEFAHLISSEYPTIPIMMLTGRSDEDTMILGLEKYADEYLLKPVLPKIIVARIHSLLRRIRQQQKIQHSVESEEEILHIDNETREVTISNTQITLTRTEFDILFLLFSHKNRVFTRDQIISHIYRTDYSIINRAIDFQVHNLRKKLGAIGECILTIRGVGYKFKNSEK